MTTISGKYIGNKRVEITHNESGAVITTSAPKDNQGDGLLFSPTDLVAASLGSCMLTIMAIVAERNAIPIEGAYFSAEKHMSQTPRRIGSLPVKIHLPDVLTAEQRTRLENAAKTCPVHHSLHAEIEIKVEFYYDVVS